MKKIFLLLAFMLFFSCSVSAGNMVINSMSYEPAPAQPGSTVTAWVQVKNNSFYEAEDVLVRIEAEYPLSLQPGQVEEINLGTLEKYQTTTVEYKLLIDPTATDGSYLLKVYTGEGFPIRKESYSINVLSRTPKLEIVSSSLSSLAPGAIEPVQFVLKNVGGSIARNIVLKINPERMVTTTGVVVEREIISLGATANYIEYLEQNQQTEVEMTLAVNQDAELKNYSVPVTMEYYDQNGTAKTETGYLGIKVTAEADVDAVINSVTPRAFPGGTSEVVVDMFNLGLAEARYVVVELSGSNLSVEEPRQFIGTLEADDFDSFKTKVTFDPAIPIGEQPIILRVVYKDEQLQERIETKALNIKVFSTGEAIEGGGPGLIIIGLISLVLQLIGLYVVARWSYPKAKVLLARIRKK